MEVPEYAAGTLTHHASLLELPHPPAYQGCCSRRRAPAPLREVLEYVANTLIFVLAGVIISNRVHTSSIGSVGQSALVSAPDYGYALLLWVYLLARALRHRLLAKRTSTLPLLWLIVSLSMHEGLCFACLSVNKRQRYSGVPHTGPDMPCVGQHYVQAVCMLERTQGLPSHPCPCPAVLPELILGAGVAVRGQKVAAVRALPGLQGLLPTPA